MGSQMLLLNWNEHKSNMVGEFQQLFSRSELTDVTLACDGCIIQAHKNVLSASSAFFHSLFSHHHCKHAFVILTDVDPDDLKALVDFIYQGQIHISQQKFTKFLKTAEKLKVKGLSMYLQNNSSNLKEPASTSGSKGVSSENTDERQSNRSDDSFKKCANSGSGQVEHANLPSENQPVRSHLDNSFQTNSNSRGESSEHAPSSEGHPVRPCQLDSFKTNESQPSVSSVTSARAMMDSSASFTDVKDKTHGMELSVREYCSVNILEPEFPSSLHNIAPSSNEIPNCQPFAMPIQSVSQETPQWVPPVFPTSEMTGPSAYVTQIGGPTIDASTSSSKECLKFGGNNSHSYQIAKFPVKAHDRSFFTNSFQCHTFQRTFIAKSKLSAHERTSAQPQTFRCTVCNKRFRQKHGLKYHMMAHFGEKPYSCSICDRKFCRPYSLTVHERIHTGEKPFICTCCGKKFSDKSNLMVHVKSH